ncbi:hypothetical protein WDU99_07975 [Microbacterium sp. Mu-80]|uniref:CARDB domain-containing protein n=1 Tax=Microbacterium bandirmense TaxID=3122050 RepID=A0ABU8LA94_9MICO
MSENEQSGVSRRTVTKAMAWAVPAVAVASTVPMAAASLPPVSLNGTFCKIPGGGAIKTYVVEVTVNNTGNTPLTVTFDALDINGVVQTVLDPASTTVPAMTRRVLTVKATGYGDSANGTAIVTYTIGGVQDTASTLPGNNIPQNNNTSAGCPATIVNQPYLQDTALS